ncbi:MAG: Gfo/Idh/MocA family oxidoreductase [Candidatus Sungiibacteriota bacterium]
MKDNKKISNGVKVKIIGAGSIGNHLAQASRRMGWEVAIVDSDMAALDRTKNEIYPNRYGVWDEEIKLFKAGEEPHGGFDIIMIGTPPDSHMKLALAAIAEDPKLLHIEKPLATPDLAGVAEFEAALREHPKTIVTVGYDHAVSESIEFVRDLMTGRSIEAKPQYGGLASIDSIGEILTIDVEFSEHWKGIFSAHPWLAGPADTYLGYWRRGGGAGGEHSHAMHLWLYFARALGWGDIKETKAMFDMQKDGSAEYDRLAAFLLKTEKSGMGRVVQDVITYPVRKWVRLQGDKGYIEWHCGGSADGDLVRWQKEGEEIKEKVFVKKRPDDFYRETMHYQKLLAGEIKPEESPLAYIRGREVMAILQEAYAGVL